MFNNSSASEFENEDAGTADAGDQDPMNNNVAKKPKRIKKTFGCHVCGEKFIDKSTVLRHIAEHEGRRFMCDYQNCDSFFKTKQALQQHFSIHTGEMPFSCSVCFKNFRQKATLYRHRKIHTGKKPYDCKVCEKKFSLLSNLKKHLRIHTGEKPYVCEACDKAFSDHTAFRRHKKIHTGVKEFTCAHCGNSYTRKETLKYHLIKCFKEHGFQDRFADH